MISRMYQIFKGLLPVARRSGYLVGGCVLLVLGGTLTACAPATPTPGLSQAVEPQLDYMGKKILFVDSYHQGYEWSDGIEAGLRHGLEGAGVELKIVRMDTKRNTDDEFRQDDCAPSAADAACKHID